MTSIPYPLSVPDPHEEPEASEAMPEPFLPGEYEHMTERGRKAWAGVDPQSLRDGSYQAQGERDEQ